MVLWPPASCSVLPTWLSVASQGLHTAMAVTSNGSLNSNASNICCYASWPTAFASWQGGVHNLLEIDIVHHISYKQREGPGHFLVPTYLRWLPLYLLYLSPPACPSSGYSLLFISCFRRVKLARSSQSAPLIIIMSSSESREGRFVAPS